MNALIITHIQMYDVIKLRLKKEKKKKKLKDVLLYVKKVSCKEQTWIFYYDRDNVRL